MREVIRSLADSAAGPSGLRPQFLKEVLGNDAEDPVVGVFAAFVQLFVDGAVPPYLRQWYGGGLLIGIGKDDKPLDEDARPIVCGEAWRRISCKVAFLDSKSELAAELKPNQVAVGMPAGAEVVLHSLRQWVHRHVGDGKTCCSRGTTRMLSMRRSRWSFWGHATDKCLVVLDWLNGVTESR